MADQRALQPVSPAKPTELVELPAVKSTAALFVDDFITLGKVADGILKSNFAPKGLKDVTDVVLVLMTGQELGLSYAQSLRMLYVVNGRPTLAADAMAAVVKRFCAQRGGGFLRVVEQTSTVCTVEYQRHDEPASSTVQFTIDDAQKANLTGKDIWKAYPQDMLRARALSRACRTGWPDVLGGVYDPDELSPAAVETTYRVSAEPIRNEVVPQPEQPAAVTATSQPTEQAARATADAPVTELALAALRAKATERNVDDTDLSWLAWFKFETSGMDELTVGNARELYKLLELPDGDLATVIGEARDAANNYLDHQASQS